MISAGVSSSLAPRIGVRPVAAVGMVLSVISMILFARMPAVGASYAVDLLPGLLVGSLGMGAIFMPLTLMATTGLDDKDQGLASGLFNTSQQVGGALGLAILSTIATSQTSDPSAITDVVHGYHYAFIGAAVLIALALAVMAALLRKHHVAQIQAEAAAPALAEA
jgi:MFS family permease